MLDQPTDVKYISFLFYDIIYIDIYIYDVVYTTFRYDVEIQSVTNIVT